MKTAALLTIVLLQSFLGATALAQGPTTGRIEGTIKDQNGAVVPRAEVKALNQASGDERIVITDDTGHYAVPLLSPGTYRLSITAPGFNIAVIDAAQVRITETTLVNV